MNYASFARDGIILSEHVAPYVHDHHALRRAVERGHLVKLRRGTYVASETWAASGPRERHILRIRAVLAVARRRVVVAGESAAAVWGMPLFGDLPTDVTVLDEWGGGGRSERGVRRTAAGFLTARSAVRDGIPVTDLARTALDVARKSSYAEALGSVDWAISRDNAFAVAKVDLASELERMRPRVGRQHLERVIAEATTLSADYGESYCRAMISLLGFAPPELQAEFRDRQGRMFSDFAWRGVRVVAEFDGKQKYSRLDYSKGDPAEVLWREKKREDRLRRLGFVVVRILWSDLIHPERLERLLVEAGVPRG